MFGFLVTHKYFYDVGVIEFNNVLSYNEIKQMATFFEDDRVIVCVEVHCCLPKEDEYDPQKFTSKLCQGLWSAYQQELCDGCTIEVENKKLKVNIFDYAIY
jgi:hypothetical protein